MRKLYKFLTPLLIVLGVTFNAKAAYMNVTCNDWSKISVEQWSSGSYSTVLHQTTDFEANYTKEVTMAMAGSAGGGWFINVAPGYKAKVTCTYKDGSVVSVSQWDGQPMNGKTLNVHTNNNNKYGADASQTYYLASYVKNPDNSVSTTKVNAPTYTIVISDENADDNGDDNGNDSGDDDDDDVAVDSAVRIGVQANDWSHAELRVYKNSQWVEDDWFDGSANEENVYYGSDGTKVKVNIKQGYIATVSKQNVSGDILVAAIEPQETPDEGFAQTFIFKISTGSSVHKERPIYVLDVQKDPNGGGDDTPEEPKDTTWPEDTYGIDITWNLPGSVMLKEKMSAKTYVTLPEGATHYTYITEDQFFPTFMVYIADGYKAKRAYYKDGDNEVEINFNASYNAYLLGHNDFDHKYVFIETEKAEENDAKFTVTFVNTPESFRNITYSTSQKTFTPAFTQGEAQEFEFHTGTDSKVQLWLNPAYTWEEYIAQEITYDENGEIAKDPDTGEVIFKDVLAKRPGKIFKLTRNGENITEASLMNATGSYYYEFEVADGDVIEVQPFEIDPAKPHFTVTLDIPDGILEKILNRATYAQVVPDAEGKISVLEGTILNLYFKDDIFVSTATLNGEDLIGKWVTNENTGKEEFEAAAWTQAGFLKQISKNNFVIEGVPSITVTADCTLKLETKAADYGEKKFTAYITNGEYVTVQENNGLGRVLDLGEGEAVDSDITLTNDGKSIVMPAATTRKYTFTISGKYESVLVTAKSGAYLYAVNSSIGKANEGNKLVTSTNFYVVANKIGNDSKAVVYYVGPQNTVALAGSRKYEAATQHDVNANGYSEFEFDYIYESPFTVKGILKSDAGWYVGGTEITTASIWVDGVAQSPNEDGVYDDLQAKDNSVIKIFADGNPHTKMPVYVQAADGAAAEITYDRVIAFTDFSAAAQCHDGTEFTVKAAKGTTIAVNQLDEDEEVVATQDIALGADGTATFALPAKKYGAEKYVLALAYSAPKVEYVLTPASDSKLTEKAQIENITIAFPGATSATQVGADDEIILKLANVWGGNPTITEVEDAECPTFNLHFNTASMVNGYYSLFIPEGFFTVDGINNPDIQASFELAVETTDFTYTANPYNGKLLWGQWGVTPAILFNDEMAQVKVADASKIELTFNGQPLASSDVMTMCEGNMLLFMATVEGAGKLHLSIAEGAVTLSGKPAPAIEEEWQVVMPVEVNMNVTPASGSKVADLTTIKIAFEGADEVEVYDPNGTGAHVSLISSNYKYNEQATVTIDNDADVPTATLTFPAPTFLGNFTLHVYNEAFTINGVQGTTNYDAEYTLVNPLADYVITPAADSEVDVEEFTGITIAFPNAAQVSVDMEQLDGVVLRNDAWKFFYAYDIVEVEDAQYPTFEFKFVSLPTTGGTYHFILPEGLFTSAGYATAEEFIDFEFIGGAAANYAWSAQPDEDIDLNESWYAEEVTLGFVFDNEDIQLELGDPMLSIYNGDTELIAGDDFTIETAWNMVNITIKSSALKAGSLEVYLGSGSLYIDGEPFYEDLSHTWTIVKPESGINDIIFDANSNVEIYNIQGIRVTNKPAAGVYIIRNGNTTSKVLVK